MSEKIKFGRSKVFFDTFNRRPGPVKTNTSFTSFVSISKFIFVVFSSVITGVLSKTSLGILIG